MTTLGKLLAYLLLPFVLFARGVWSVLRPLEVVDAVLVPPVYTDCVHSACVRFNDGSVYALHRKKSPDNSWVPGSGSYIPIRHMCLAEIALEVRKVRDSVAGSEDTNSSLH